MFGLAFIAWPTVGLAFSVWALTVLAFSVLPEAVSSVGGLAIMAFFAAARLLINDFFGTDMVSSSLRVFAMLNFLRLWPTPALILSIGRLRNQRLRGHAAFWLLNLSAGSGQQRNLGSFHQPMADTYLFSVGLAFIAWPTVGLAFSVWALTVLAFSVLPEAVSSVGGLAIMAFFAAARLLINDFFGTDMVSSSLRVFAM